MRIAILALPLVLGVLAPSARAAHSPVDMTVVDDPGLSNGIAVYRSAGRGGPDYWCSAGWYAARKYGPTGFVLTLERPLGAAGGPSNRQSMGFSVSPGQGGDSGVYSLDRVGERHAVSAARGLCQVRKQQMQRDSRE